MVSSKFDGYVPDFERKLLTGMHEEAFDKCLQALKESRADYQAYLPVIADVLTVYLYNLAKYCLLDQGQSQAVASCLLADFWREKGWTA